MSKKIIMLTRGDTYTLKVEIPDREHRFEKYILKDDDVLYFGIMDPYQPFEDALVKKRFTKEDCDENGDIYITLTAEDTVDLIPGVYYYAIKLHRLTSNEIEKVDIVSTIVNRTKLVVFE